VAFLLLQGYMIEGQGSKSYPKSKGWLYKHPEASADLLERLVQISVPYLVGQVKAGAQLLQVFESWAGELSEELFTKFSLKYLAQIASETKAALRKEGCVHLSFFSLFCVSVSIDQRNRCV
jgi:uroporphyrinogen decarboxylase